MRKSFMGGVCFVFSAAVLLATTASAKKPAGGLPRPEKSGIQHIVVVMMENRSFDHFLGWLPGAAGQQAGLAYNDKNGVAQSTWALAPDYQGCGYADPDHSYDGGRAQLDGGLCDGWLLAGTDDLFPIGYYTQSDEPFLGRAAGDWTVLDHYFAPILAPTYPNRIYQHAAVTDRLDDSLFPPSTLPTIWDRLAELRFPTPTKSSSPTARREISRRSRSSIPPSTANRAARRPMTIRTATSGRGKRSSTEPTRR